MHKKSRSIPVNYMADESGAGISIEKLTFKDLNAVAEANLANLEEAKSAHRHDGHSFFLVECGKVSIEIDFQKYQIIAPALIYLHPNQVHRTTAFEDVTVSSWAITNENLHPEYLKLLEDINPAKPLALTEETFSIMSESVLICLKLSDRKNDKLYHSTLKDSCNTLVALVISEYLESAKPTDHFSRFEIVNKGFRDLLERNFTTLKRPAAYAEKLNISIPYLNECIKNTTGYSVSHHIHQRVVLEAKRLLSHSDQTVKEIAAALGYDDYPYFSRLFTKVTGITALAFRNKNHD